MKEQATTNQLVTLQKNRLSPKEKFFSRVMLLFEDVIKVPFFRCQRCGECILSHTAFVCSQRCPKRLRNGPCGGTGEGGTCEVFPERKCIWHLIYRRARLWRRILLLRRIEKIHNWELEKTSAWLNVLKKRIEPPILSIKRKN